MQASGDGRLLKFRHGKLTEYKSFQLHLKKISTLSLGYFGFENKETF
jgi:hypothetical protein